MIVPTENEASAASFRRSSSTSVSSSNSTNGVTHLDSSTYGIWKWRSFQFRRFFFFCLLQLALIFSWFSLTYVLNGSNLWSEGKFSHSNNLLRSVETLSTVFFLLHCVLFAFVMLTRYAQRMLHNSQGRRLCEFSGFSMLLCMLLTSVALSHHVDHVHHDRFFTTGVASFVALSLVAMAAFPQMGVSAPAIVVLKYVSVLVYVVFLALVVSIASSFTVHLIFHRVKRSLI